MTEDRGLTNPLRDPIIYPGTQELTYPEHWIRVHSGRYQCTRGSELIPPGTIARHTGTGWECHAHTHPEPGAETPTVFAASPHETRR